ncbi:sensor histidine kinase [Streptomyces sulphureus]|uniref:sensor histidine kinase n=1 Tax=Streptomyces sulphureus TaxID=47758 RepID=UPI00037A7F93|nr:sensor histidine kinase [Streptomyces sulphureus]
MIDTRRVRQTCRRFGVPAVCLLLGLALFAVSFLPGFESHGTELGGVPTRDFDVFTLVVVVLQCAPLVFCRRWPAVCLALVSLGFVCDQLRGYHTVAATALPFALLGAGAYLEWHRRAVVLALSAAYVPLVFALWELGSGEPPHEFVTFYLLLVLVWAAGAWLRSYRATEAERRLRVAEETRAAERARLARELHDVVTHHVTAMVVQAEAARYLTAAPDRLDQALTAVTDTGRRAVTDLRHLLDLLDPGHEAEARTPAAGGLSTLVEQTRKAGQPVEFTEEGAPAESTGGADVVAYRVVQEALTNALKYARGSRTWVQVRHGGREVAVEVGTEGAGSPAASPGGSGRGLAGLRERVDVLGGDFSAEQGEDDRFVVRARIPARGPS